MQPPGFNPAPINQQKGPDDSPSQNPAPPVRINAFNFGINKQSQNFQRGNKQQKNFQRKNQSTNYKRPDPDPVPNPQPREVDETKVKVKPYFSSEKSFGPINPNMIVQKK